VNVGMWMYAPLFLLPTAVSAVLVAQVIDTFERMEWRD
jgi:hypothetical protein